VPKSSLEKTSTLSTDPTNGHGLPMMPATPELEKQLEAVVERYRFVVKRAEISS
jgi:hypothetical protein